MKKSIKIIAGVTATLLTLGVAGCQKNTVYPNFINNSGSGITKPETKEKYVVNVQSVGGAKLNGVRVNALSNGQVVRRGISVDGVIDFPLALGEYELQVDEASLPAGYKMPTDTYKTSATTRDEVTIELSSELIPEINSALCSYTLGTIMRDFTFTDCNGGEGYTLSKLLKEKKAVVLNFWYPGCNPCRAEFPAIQKAYASRDDIEILAICSTHQGDTNTTVSKFKEDLKLTFPMGIDTVGLNRAFNVGAFPTTVIIDRYGMIAYRSQGTETTESFWTRMFNNYTSDKYRQPPNPGNGNNPGPPGDSEIEKPDIAMPDSSVLEAAANAPGFNCTFRAENDEYSWPWLAGKDEDGTSFIYSSNSDKDNSYSIVYADIEMEKGDVLSFDYYVDSEADHDYLHVLLDGDLMSGKGYSATNGWISKDLYVADCDKSVELAFAFRKDDADPDEYTGEDVARIRNIHLSDISGIKKPIDVMRTCASGITEGSLKYDNYVNAVYNEDDGFYHKDTKDGALIYISLSQLTPWTDMHTSSTTVTGNTTYYSTLYYLTYYNYAVYSGDNFNVTIGDLDITRTLQNYWSIQGYMPSPYYLLPVTRDLKNWAQKFVEEYDKKLNFTAHDKEWLEFCYYYDHYGSENFEHDDGDCFVNVDRTRGLSIENSFVAYEKNDPEIVKSDKYNPKTGRMKAEINYPLQTQRNGSYYEFKANQTGVYQIRAYTKDCSSKGTVPGLSIYSANGNIIDIADEPRDFDQFMGVEYDDFNYYLSLEANQTVYLYLQEAPAATGYYEFEIEYKGATYEKLYVCSTSSGAWSGSSEYLAIRVAYDSDTDRYYAADRRGNPDMSRPIYIDMTHTSYLYSEKTDVNLHPLEDIINKGYFNNVDTTGTYQLQLRQYLADAKANGVTLSNGETLLGLVEADSTIVKIINAYIDKYVDGGMGNGNGWLAFGVYMCDLGQSE